MANASSNKAKLLSDLKFLADRKPTWKTTAKAKEVIEHAFKFKSPLFVDSDRPIAADLLLKSSPSVDATFVEIQKSMNPDLRSRAQICRSGLQFLVDDFKDFDATIYEKLQETFVQSTPVRLVEKVIANLKGVEPEDSVQNAVDISHVPTSHYWWP